MNLENIGKTVAWAIQILTLLSIIGIVYFVSSIFLAPKAFNITLLNPTEKVTLCLGQDLKIETVAKVLRTPSTIFKSETWFSEDLNQTVVWAKVGDVKVYNWDKGVMGDIPRVSYIKTPTTYNDLTTKIPEGNYRYIVHYTTLGSSLPVTTSLAVPVKLKKCQ